MGKTVRIELLTKVEGHGRVTIHLDDTGHVEHAHFHVTEFRGFEKFCQGRTLWDMPNITSRICGICPVSHHLAAVKAAEAVLGVTPPPAAHKLRELMHMGQLIQSHALHFFFLAGPDFILDEATAPKDRSVAGVVAKDPELARQAIALRKVGQDVVDAVGGRPIHPVTAVPGGQTMPLSHEARHLLSRRMSGAVELAESAAELAQRFLETHQERLPSMGDRPTLHLGMVRDDATLELYDGDLRLVDAGGTVVDHFIAADYASRLAERVEPNSYLKSPYYLPRGFEGGTYRVGPLARLNVAHRIPTSRAHRQLQRYREHVGSTTTNENLHYHWARTIEILYAVERAAELLADDDVVSEDCRVPVEPRAGEGVGVIEAPRGTLIHHYAADDRGKITKVNLIVATAHNNRAIDGAVGDVARLHVSGNELTEGILNRVEMAVRCFDPCLSCSTHALGQMPLRVDLVDAHGTLLQTRQSG